MLNKSSIFWTIVIIILLLLFLPDPESIKGAIEEIKKADISWIILGILLYIPIIPLNGLQLITISEVRLKFWVTIKVQTALQFISKLLPASVSSLVVNTFYLHKAGHKPSQAASVIAMKALTSSAAYIGLTIAAILLGFGELGKVSLKLDADLGILGLIKLFALLLVLLVGISWAALKIQKTREFISKTFGSFWSQFKSYKKEKDVAIAIFYSTVASILGILVLFASSRSLGLDVTFTQTFIIYTLGNTLATLIPVPGGIGAAEAGLYAGFTLFGYPPSQSLAAVTVYRVISFYLPTIPGLIAFVNLRKDLFSNFHFNTDFLKKYKTTKG